MDPSAQRGCRDHYCRPRDAFQETKGFVDCLRDPRCKIPYSGLWHRLSKGWSIEERDLELDSPPVGMDSARSRRSSGMIATADVQYSASTSSSKH